MKCCDLTAGKLRHVIDIVVAVETPDGGGGSDVTPTVVASPRAFIKPISGGERFHAMRMESDVTHRIFIRYPTGWYPTADNWITFEGREFQIRAVLNLEERNRWLEIYAEEGPSL